MNKILKLAVNPQVSKPDSIPCDIKVDQDYLRKVVEKLSFERVFGTPENLRAKDIILDEFNGMMAVSVDMPYRNICMGYPKTAKVLIGAHYDSVPGSPGADDNASAVAVMLAVAKAIGYNEDVCYVAFNSEEYGLRGSEDFVKNLGRNQLQQVHILEMVGYRDRSPGSQQNPLPIESIRDTGDFIGLVGNSYSLVGKVLKQAGVMTIPAVGLCIPNMGAKLVNLEMVEKFSPDVLRSDHSNFWAAGIPAIMWTDTSNFRNPNYHKSTDTPDTLDYEFMAEVSKLLIRLSTI